MVQRLNFEDGFYFDPKTKVGDTQNDNPAAKVVKRPERLPVVRLHTICNRPNGTFNAVTRQTLEFLIGKLFDVRVLWGTSVFRELDRATQHGATLGTTEHGRRILKALRRVRLALLELNEACRAVKELDRPL